jgi:hypothetical protein
MPFTGLLVLLSITAPSSPPPSATPSTLQVQAAEAASRAEPRETPRCPETLRLEGVNRRLIEVPDTPVRLADKTGGMPGWVPQADGWPVPCVTPARR